jgi:4-hydroxyphenylacetate 3-monooxygenase
VAQQSGLTDHMKGLVEQCMSEYDLDGWTTADMISPDDVNFFANGHQERFNGSAEQ